ncbi:MAG: hypothetical protein A2719_04090 [Candidatus Ryanbacteria bacterium RIFCSPHIGHO2_01_FULL_45_22]|uniref:Uncharacterized protein n=1 Tax=Candidatus Ryanbacteria bacterium RIFCSPHIGHO2_01_FULL_45_22 TaxID=1802114 RepID=A0A1G2G333_9BACT|nr:MAG: hypothetical protein A2719_04090 [Candidatus Ryanbacteria bacterium RIFCSPHIGHO2_01_FULL_45_22]
MEKRATISDKLKAFFSEFGSGGTNQKFPFLHFSPFGGGGGGSRKKMVRKFLGLPRASPRARPRRVPAQSGRTLQFQATTHAERAK